MIATLYGVRLLGYAMTDVEDQVIAKTMEEAVEAARVHHKLKLAEVISCEVIATDVETN